MKVNVLNILDNCIGIIKFFFYFMTFYFQVKNDFIGVAIIGNACVIFIVTIFYVLSGIIGMLVTGIWTKLARKIRCRKVERLTNLLVVSAHRDTGTEDANSHYREELLFDSDN